MTSGSERRKFYRHRREGGTTSRENVAKPQFGVAHSVAEGVRTTQIATQSPIRDHRGVARKARPKVALRRRPSGARANQNWN